MTRCARPYSAFSRRCPFCSNIPPSHRAAILQALFVTFLWSTSWVIIKLGLYDIPALTFAGLRYALASLCLLPFAATRTHRASLRSLSRTGLARLALLGVMFIAFTQGAQFLGLAYLPAVSVSLLYNFTPLVVAALGILLLSERLRTLQWLGVGLYTAGVAAYFLPPILSENEMPGLVVVALGVLSNAASAVLGRQINQSGMLHPLLVTVVSMSVGATVLLVFGLMVEGLPPLSAVNWLAIGWLAVVNTALAFPLWNNTLRTLSAVESSVINSTLLVQIAVLAWLFLGERVNGQQLVGMLLVTGGALLVQWRRKPVAPADTSLEDKKHT